MSEWLMKRIVFYGKNGNRYKLKILNYIRRILLRFYNPVIKVQIGDKKLYMNLSHQLPIYLVQHKLYDTALARLVKQLGTNKKLNIIDVGANIGDTVALIKTSNKNVDILCIEGNHEYLSLLKKNYSDDNFVTIEATFCSDVSEIKSINLDTSGGTATIDLNTTSDKQAEFLTLDEIIKKHSRFSNIDFIKVDTDGFDYKVLRGAIEVLKNQQPFVFFELDKHFLSKNNENIMSIFELFENNEYESFILYDNYGYLVGLFTFEQLTIVEDIINYMDNKQMYLDVLMIKDSAIAKKLYESENDSIDTILKEKND